MGLLPHVILPGWLLSSTSANSALLNLRLLRILKFQRILTDKDTYMKFELALGMRESDVRPYQLQLARVAVSIFTLVSVSTGLIYAAEHEVNPDIPDYFTALYFGLTTLTTVGFGDISPVTSPPSSSSSASQSSSAENVATSPGKSERRCAECGAMHHRSDASFCWSCGLRLR